MKRNKIPQEILDEMLLDGYGTFETGVKMLPSGDAFVANMIPMPNCKGKMIAWWFGSFLENTSQYKFWHRDHTTFEWDDKKKPGTCVGATHFSAEYISGELLQMAIRFYDPMELFDAKKLEAANVGAVICAEITSGENHYATFIHLVQDTSVGANMKSRFWLDNSSIEGGRGLNKHNIEEMVNLSQFLPGLYGMYNR